MSQINRGDDMEMLEYKSKNFSFITQDIEFTETFFNMEEDMDTVRKVIKNVAERKNLDAKIFKIVRSNKIIGGLAVAHIDMENVITYVSLFKEYKDFTSEKGSYDFTGIVLKEWLGLLLDAYPTSTKIISVVRNKDFNIIKKHTNFDIKPIDEEFGTIKIKSTKPLPYIICGRNPKK